MDEKHEGVSEKLTQKLADSAVTEQAISCRERHCHCIISEMAAEARLCAVRALASFINVCDCRGPNCGE